MTSPETKNEDGEGGGGGRAHRTGTSTELGRARQRTGGRWWLLWEMAGGSAVMAAPPLSSDG
jgi:hypothetical protein